MSIHQRTTVSETFLKKGAGRGHRTKLLKLGSANIKEKFLKGEDFPNAQSAKPLAEAEAGLASWRFAAGIFNSI